MSQGSGGNQSAGQQYRPRNNAVPKQNSYSRKVTLSNNDSGDYYEAEDINSHRGGNKAQKNR